MVPWEARWYQARILRDKSPKKVARWGRRTGKCLPGWVKIYDPIEDRTYPVEEIFKRGFANIVTMKPDNSLVRHSTNKIFYNGIKPVYNLTLDSGKEIDATANHPFYTKEGWVELGDLKEGEEIASVFKLPEGAKPGSIQWERILSVKHIGDYVTYDLTVPETHNFVANDIIVHNTDMMCIDALHKAFVTPYYRALFITPYENQVRLIFTRLRELIDGSPFLNNEVTKLTNNPFQATFKNNASIMGFTTGAASGSGGASIRGQKGDYLYLDEVDKRDKTYSPL